jgi:hypothetical protein
MDPFDRINLIFVKQFAAKRRLMDPLKPKQRYSTFRTPDAGEVGSDYVDDTFEVNRFNACLDNR